MEQQNNTQTLLRHTMTIGAYAGIAYSLIYLIFYLSNVLFSPVSEYLIYLVSITAVYYGVNQYKMSLPEQKISYSTALKSGFFIIFWGSLILSFFIFILLYIDTSLLGKYLMYFEDYLSQSSTYSKEQVDMLLEFYRTFLTPTIVSLMELIGKSFMGFLFSLIISIFIVRKNTTFNQK